MSNFENIIKQFVLIYKQISSAIQHSLTIKETMNFLKYDTAFEMFLNDIVLAGYCPNQLLKAIENEREIDLLCEIDLMINPYARNLKQAIDKDFNIRIDKPVIDLEKQYLSWGR